MNGTVKMVELGSIQNGHTDHAGARIWTRAWPRKQHETIHNFVSLREKYNYLPILFLFHLLQIVVLMQGCRKQGAGGGPGAYAATQNFGRSVYSNSIREAGADYARPHRFPGLPSSLISNRVHKHQASILFCFLRLSRELIQTGRNKFHFVQ